jgi:hypothetical protein
LCLLQSLIRDQARGPRPRRVGRLGCLHLTDWGDPRRDTRAFQSGVYNATEGESSSDVYNRVAILEDHLLRDMRAGRYGARSSVVVVSP